MKTVIKTVDLTQGNSVSDLIKALNKCNETARIASGGTHGGNGAILVHEAYRGAPLREVCLIEEVLSDGSKVYNVGVTF